MTTNTNGLITGIPASAALTSAQVNNFISSITPIVSSALPPASTAGIGAKYIVTDALLPTVLSVLTGGGAVVVPVYSNGTNWIIG